MTSRWIGLLRIAGRKPALAGPGANPGNRRRLGLFLIAGLLGAASCSRDYQEWPREYPPVSVVVSETISTTAGTRVLFTECIQPDGLQVKLMRRRDGAEALAVTITGPRSAQGCITEAVVTPAYSLENEASYTLAIDSPAVNFSTVVAATSTFQYRPGVYLMVNTDYAVLEGFAEHLRTWFVEFGEPDAGGAFDIWLVDADPPEEQKPPVCFNWSAQPTSEGGGIGWNAHTRGVLNDRKEQFSSAAGEILDIDVQPIACIKGARFESQAVPAGETLSGWMNVDRVEIPCGVPQEVDKVYYTGRRCPEAAVLPHP